MYIAAARGQVESIRVLKELGADINQADHDGVTPLHIAAAKGHVEVLRVLNQFKQKKVSKKCVVS